MGKNVVMIESWSPQEMVEDAVREAVALLRHKGVVIAVATQVHYPYHPNPKQDYVKIDLLKW